MHLDALDAFEPDAQTRTAGSGGEAERWQAFQVVPGRADTPLLILCDHATNLMPAEYGTLGLGHDQLARHIAYDIGALPVALQMGKILGATVVYSRFSRLLIDPNRGRDDPTLVMQLSDGAVIPGNAHVDEREIERRIARFMQPYHSAIQGEIDAMIRRGLVPGIFSLHSYTNVWRGVLRKWHGAVLWDNDPRLPVPLMRELAARSDYVIGDNEPYSGRLKGNTIWEYGTRLGLPNVLFEIRQDLIRDADGQTKWAQLLSDCLTSIYADEEQREALSRVALHDQGSDMIGDEHNGL
jgi:predicted N-formylglutamate amidohydrolase